MIREPIDGQAIHGPSVDDASLDVLLADEEIPAMRVRTILAASVAIAALAIAGSAQAAPQGPEIKRTPLQKHDLKAPGHEGVMALVELPPGAREGRHSHPSADLLAYVVEGTLTLDVEGKPTATYKAGDSAFIEAGKVHEGINNSKAPVKLIGVFVAEKGKPMTAPAK